MFNEGVENPRQKYIVAIYQKSAGATNNFTLRYVNSTNKSFKARVSRRHLVMLNLEEMGIVLYADVVMNHFTSCYPPTHPPMHVNEDRRR